MEAREDTDGIEPPDTGAKKHVLVEWASTFGAGRDIPSKISDHDGRVWHVTQILDHWRHPDHMGHRATLGCFEGGLTAVRYLLEVTGPLPRDGATGTQRVWVRSYGDGAGWYLRPDNPGQRQDNTGRERAGLDWTGIDTYLQIFTGLASTFHRCRTPGSPSTARSPV